jgi:hypothetical protein
MDKSIKAAMTVLEVHATMLFAGILGIPVQQRRIVAYLDGLQAKVSALRELQSASGDSCACVM